MLVQEPIQAAIWHCLNNYAFNDAIFLAERLNAEVKSDESLYLLATCYYRANKRNQCYSILQNKLDSSELNPRCRYLLALCCFELNKLVEAESLLTGNLHHKKGKMTVIDAVSSTFGDMAPFACQLLGRINLKASRSKEAYGAFLQSLKLNPFLWDSFDSICQTGENINPDTVFQTAHLDNFGMCHGTQTVVALGGNQNQEPIVVGVGNLSVADIQPTSNSSLFHTPVLGKQNPKQVPLSTEEITLTVLNPSNKNRQQIKTQRLLFTSTPMGNKSMFGFTQLERSSTDQSTANHSALSPFMTVSSFLVPSHDFSEPRPKKLCGCIFALDEKKSLLPIRKVQRSCSSVAHSFTKPAFAFPSSSLNPCLRVPPSWQQQQQTPSILSSMTPPLVTPLQQPLSPQTANVRRSSRLFSNSNSNVSVKENSKTPARARVPPSKSPGRKNKIRGPKTPAVTANNNSTYQENQKNAQHNEGDTPAVIDNEGAGDFVYATPPCEKFITNSSVGSVLPQGAVNSSALALTALNFQKQSTEGLMSLLRTLAKAHLQVRKYECKEAIVTLSSLSPQHRDSGWVLGTKAKAYFEMSFYDDAIRTYQHMRKVEPYRVSGLEWMSTALWHVQREIDLSALAHDLLVSERQHPATWITAGNCFSLNKEHETAIKFFERAIQVDNDCAYGYTLLGHEYVAIEELDRALKCFRTAIRKDPRHYNAWYGLGMIYYKQERYQRAETYYKKALALHPKNPVLLCHLGVVQHALSYPEKSLASFGKALQENPKNALCKFHRASVLFALNRLDEALTELQELKNIVPKESLIYFLIAKIYTKKGDTHQALLHFAWATDLDPKGANNQIKESIEPVLSRSFSSVANLAEMRDVSDSSEGNESILINAGGADVDGNSTIEASNTPDQSYLN